MVLSQGAVELGKIKPTYGVVATLVSGAIALFTRSLTDYFAKYCKTWAISGLLLLGGVVITYLASPLGLELLGPETVRLLGTVGAILALVGRSLGGGTLPPTLPPAEKHKEPYAKNSISDSLFRFDYPVSCNLRVQEKAR